MAPVKRGLLGYIADSFYTWQNSLPPMACGYTIESLQIPVAADLKLAANLYLTDASPPAGTLLVRTPYGIDFLPSLSLARYFAARGYHVLLNACRGTSGSDGEREPGTHEVADGHAVVDWMRKQSWYTGSFGTLGGSYLGMTQWALLTDPPKDMKAAAIFTGPHDMYDFQYGSGALYSHIITWADITNRMNSNDGLISLMHFMRTIPGRYKAVLSSVPLLDSVDRYFSGSTPEWLRTVIETPDRTAPFWQRTDISASIDKANIPILLVTGWYDVSLESVIEQYARLSERSIQVRLIIGPWTHLGAQGRNVPLESLPLMEQHLARRSKAAESAAVRVFVSGRQEWRENPRWPPPTSSADLYLGPDDQLSWTKPGTEDARSTFTFDPNDPTPDFGAPLGFTISVGTTDQNNALIARSDVLTWTSTTLDTGLEVHGKPSVVIYHSTDVPHADLLVILSEVDERGISRYLSERYIRLSPERDTGPLQLALSSIAHYFQPGRKIRLSVAGGSHPRYIRNLGSGEPAGTGTTLRAVQHIVQHHATAVSRIRLPVTRGSS